MSAENSQSAHGASRETERLCRCGNRSRPDHWDCDACHAAESSIYRARQIYRRKQAMSDAIGAIAIQAKAGGT